MLRKYFFVLGLFLATGFLFLNVSIAGATSYTWTGGGDALTWTDPLNWGQAATYFGGFYPYPGATSTADTVTIASKSNAGNFIVRATTTPAGTLSSLIIGGVAGSTNGSAQLIIGNGATISASSTVLVVSTSTLTMGDATWGSGTLRLTNGANNSIPLSIGSNATFTADATATGTVTYAGGWNGGAPGNTILIASTTFYTLNITPTTTAANLTFKVATSTSVTIGAGGGTFSSGATFSVASGATLTLNGTITATNATWTNSGTVTEGAGGKILNTATSVQFTDSSGTTLSSLNADGNGSIYLTVTDPDQNLLPSIETLNATITSKSAISTAQTVTLTETSASSGIFRGGLTFTLSGTAVGGALAYQGNGTLNYSWTDAQDAADTSSCTGCANFTGTSPGGGSPSTGTTDTSSNSGTTNITQTTTTVTTPIVTSVAPATTNQNTTTVVTPAVPTLSDIQSKISSVVAQVASLTKNSSVSDIATVQAQIVSILNDIKSLQSSLPAPKGVALGFHFVRPLALGMSDNEVKNLQSALKTDSSIYPEGKVTGYFGSATLKAIQRFQEKYGIASSGESGYGKVGPKTRTKLNELYGNK